VEERPSERVRETGKRHRTIRITQGQSNTLSSLNAAFLEAPLNLPLTHSLYNIFRFCQEQFNLNIIKYIQWCRGGGGFLRKLSVTTTFVPELLETCKQGGNKGKDIV